MALIIDPTIDQAAIHDIKELDTKINQFLAGDIDSEKFRGFRLARGVYGQRQLGVQMIRIKLPYGRITPEQLIRIADVSDEFASGNLHATTRQDIQIHYVKLANTPQVWAKLEEKQITLREACGNTVRNITASATAGIEPDELFDVAPYAHAMYKYFLRNPICQELGRKIKIAFSSSDKDTAYTWIHDLGFIPRIQDGKLGFKVVVGGGLGAQPFLAHVAFEFLEADQLIPYAEATLRVFDRYGERTRRNKARMKYLISDLGFEEFTKLVEEERTAIKNKSFKIELDTLPEPIIPTTEVDKNAVAVDADKYERWFKTNVFEQKQKGFYAVQVKLLNGDMKTDIARSFAAIADKYADKDIRITVNQGYMLKFVKPEYLVTLFNELNNIGFAEPGFDSTADITACPGTDTCNLGIASSTGLTEELEKVMKEEYKDIIYNTDIKIKISGCMNACGQHSAANIGFHGMSLKSGELVLPAMQVLLGGGLGEGGKFSISEKVIKVPSKNVPDVLRALLNDFDENQLEGEYYNDYFQRQTKNYFYQLLKPFGNTKELTQDHFLDWGTTDAYETLVGVGECAGVMVDLVQILLNETKEKLNKAQAALEAGIYADGIYHAYNVFVNSAKALLLGRDVTCNTQIGVLKDFDAQFVATEEFSFEGKSFRDFVLEINKNEPTAEFAKQYITEATSFISNVIEFRNKQIAIA
jgi:sulfite reductase (ferredoxin)